MGIAAELYLDEEQEPETFDRMVKACGGYFEEKGMHDVLYAISFGNWWPLHARRIRKLGIEDLAILNGQPDDQPPAMMAWKEPAAVAEAADRLVVHLESRNRKVGFLVRAFNKQSGNADEAATEMGLAFRPGEGGWAILAQDMRILASVCRWLKAEGVPRLTFVQNL